MKSHAKPSRRCRRPSLIALAIVPLAGCPRGPEMPVRANSGAASSALEPVASQAYFFGLEKQAHPPG